MPASISDVARLAKVSISTVSRVMNRRSVVNAQTRVRVETAIRELGYQPNAFARGLMLRRSEVIGLVLPDLHGEFYSEIIRGANQQAHEMGYNLLVSSEHAGSDGHSLLSAIQQRSFLDGVAVMVSELSDQVQEVLAEFRLPVVVLDGDIAGKPHDSVAIDQKAGAQALMRHVIEQCARKRIIFVGGLKTNLDTIARYDAYRRALTDHDLAAAPRDAYFLDYSYETAYLLATEHVKTWAGAQSCVFAANDEMAAGIVAAAHAAGLTLPRDLAIVGFDDTRVARMTRPALTTVRVPMAKMGAYAVELLCQRITDPQRPPTRISLTPELVIRESCGHGARKREK